MKQFTLIVIILLFAVDSVFAGNNWYTLAPNEIYVTDFILKPDNKKEITIESSTEETVMFRAELGKEDSDKIVKGPYPIAIRQIGSTILIESFYGGRKYTPTNGKIELEISNKGVRPYKILIIKTKK